MIDSLVTTIIPVRNRPALLGEAVQSVLDQEYPHTEIIVVDDASTDATPQVAAALAARYPDVVRLERQPRCQGPGAARQRALVTARGAFIQYLDSDDLLLPGKFHAQVAALQANPDADICYGRSYQENHYHQPVTTTGPIRATGESLTRLFPHLLRERWWTTSSPLYRHSLCRRMGPWLPLINEEDWEYDARAAAHGARLVAVDRDVSVRRIGLSSDHLSLHAEQDPRKLADKATVRLAIHRHALASGQGQQGPEMLHFYRAALVLSRQCALAGLAAEAEALYSLVRSHAGPPLRNHPALRLYGRMAHLVGWHRAARVAAGITALAQPFRRCG